MAITQAMTTSFKVDLLNGVHSFGVSVVRADTSADTFKIALFGPDAAIGQDTTVYTTAEEVTGTGYTAGGQELTISTAPTSAGNIAYLSFSNVVWNSATFTARGALIYNETQGNKAVAVIDFGEIKAPSNANFTLAFPTTDIANVIVRLG